MASAASRAGSYYVQYTLSSTVYSAEDIIKLPLWIASSNDSMVGANPQLSAKLSPIQLSIIAQQLCPTAGLCVPRPGYNL